MIIEKVSIKGLFGKKDRDISLTFHRDMNIVTGKNGAGKTTALKVIWYIISGNIERAFDETPFDSATVETDYYTIHIIRRNPQFPYIEFQPKGKDQIIFEVREVDDDGDPFDGSDPVSDANNAIGVMGQSLFFPTFRRIEGGFSMSSSIRRQHIQSGLSSRVTRSRGDVEEAVTDLARRLSNARHIFISSISTVDIVNLLMRNYTDLSERTNIRQQEVSQDIIQKIMNYKRRGGDSSDPASSSEANASAALDKIRDLIQAFENERIQIMSPLEGVRQLVERLFQHSGILLSSRLTFGDAANAISSDSLSAGEKQMLSFICYNAFYSDAPIFIDEPELSLHVDWQRQLFGILERQKSNNQFIIATHSPFIYSKFGDKELQLGSLRGDEQVE